MERVLEGVKVIELSQYAAAPAAGRLLAEMGADVVKVEPLSGDSMRYVGPSFGLPGRQDENVAFQMVNAGKKSIALDLKSPEGQEIMDKLLAGADIFFTNVRMKALQSLGLSWEALHERHPRLIFGHVSGYGLKGDDAGLPGYDATAFWARGGALIDLPYEGSAPLTTPYCFGDLATGMTLVAGMASALRKQLLTGEGDCVLVSLFGTAIYLGGYMIASTQKGKEAQGYRDKFPKVRTDPPTPLTTTYLCRDGKGLMLFVPIYDKAWPVVCRLLQREDLVDDVRYSTQRAAMAPEHKAALVTLISEIMLTRDAQDWADAFAAANIATGVAQHFSDVSEDPMAWENGYLSSYTYPNGNSSVIINSPIQFKENTPVACAPAPGLGASGEELLAQLGYAPEQIAALR